MPEDFIIDVLRAIRTGKGVYRPGLENTIELLIPGTLTEADADRIRSILDYFHKVHTIELRVAGGSRSCSRLVFEADSPEALVKFLGALADDPKAIQLIKELGGDFRIVTKNPYQTVSSKSPADIRTASDNCSKFLENTNHTIQVEIRKDPKSGKVVEIIEEDTTIHKTTTSGDFVSDIDFLSSEVFACDTLDESVKASTLTALRHLRAAASGQFVPEKELKESKNWLEKTKDELASKIPKALDFIVKVITIAEKYAKAYNLT